MLFKELPYDVTEGMKYKQKRNSFIKMFVHTWFLKTIRYLAKDLVKTCVNAFYVKSYKQNHLLSCGHTHKTYLLPIHQK